MSDTPRARLAMLDLLWGFLAFAAVMVSAILSQDIRPFALVTFVLFAGAAFYRVGKRSGSLVPSAAFVFSGGVIPALTLNRLHLALTAPHETFIILFVITSLLGAVLGVLLRVLSKEGKTKQAVAFGSLAVLAVGAAVLKVVPTWMEAQAYRAVNQEAAPFQFQTLDGKTITSEELKGHIVVLSFWATWCPPCQGEMPEIDAVAEHYRGNQKVLFVALNAGTGGDDTKKAQAYLLRKKLGITGAIDSLDGQSWGPAAKSLGVPFLPVLYILDSGGRVRFIHSGYDASENLRVSLPHHIDTLR